MTLKHLAIDTVAAAEGGGGGRLGDDNDRLRCRDPLSRQGAAQIRKLRHGNVRQDSLSKMQQARHSRLARALPLCVVVVNVSFRC